MSPSQCTVLCDGSSSALTVSYNCPEPLVQYGSLILTTFKMDNRHGAPHQTALHQTKPHRTKPEFDQLPVFCWVGIPMFVCLLCN